MIIGVLLLLLLVVYSEWLSVVVTATSPARFSPGAAIPNRGEESDDGEAMAGLFGGATTSLNVSLGIIFIFHFILFSLLFCEFYLINNYFYIYIYK
jgi:hypothetical protein